MPYKDKLVEKEHKKKYYRENRDRILKDRKISYIHIPITEAQKGYNKKYQQSDKGKAARKQYRQTEKRKAAIKRYNQSDRGKVSKKRSKLKSFYNLSLEDYNKLVDKQEGKCAICGRLDGNLCVDHNHITGKIRGLLCRMCNLILGNAGDNIGILSNSIEYLENSEGIR